MTHIAFYPGSFDPVTHGHTDIIERCARLYDEVVIGVGVHPTKTPLFTASERIEMLSDEVAPISEKFGVPIQVQTFDDLVVDAAKRAGAQSLIRGIRDTTDFNYEVQMAGMNGTMAPEVETVFLAASPAVRHVAANLVRQIAQMGGDPSPFVSSEVAERIRAKVAGTS